MQKRWKTVEKMWKTVEKSKEKYIFEYCLSHNVVMQKYFFHNAYMQNFAYMQKKMHNDIQDLRMSV